MGIYLLSLSHKTTPLEIRSLFAYPEAVKVQILKELLDSGCIDEAVVLSTCNRMELYCHGLNGQDLEEGRGGSGDRKENAREIGQVLEVMEQAAMRAAGLCAGEDMARARQHVRRYHGRPAVHHLFQVAAGLDSMVLGEDQILGQVKQAYEFSRERGYCKTCFNTLFRDAVTGAKRVKTDTLLSKTPVSTATLAVKAAEESLGGLQGKKMMVIGATGRIGNIILKNVQDIPGLEVFVTMRSHSSPDKLGHGVVCQTIPYEDRYQWMDRMDVVISATSSPHYTVTAFEVKQWAKTPKNRVFLDLAVPPDIEGAVEGQYINIEDLARLARQNNERKVAELGTANQIIEEYENRFYKWLLFQSYEGAIERLKASVLGEACEKGVEAAVSRLFYQLREAGSVDEVEGLLRAADKANHALQDVKRPAPRPKRQTAGQTAFFPLFFSLEHKKALVVGAGKIASRRAEILAEFGADVWLVAPEGSELAARLAREGAVHWERRCFQPTDIEGCCLVIAATDDGEVNGQVVRLCRDRHILVNHAGDRSRCDFYFPGIAREGGLVAGVTASGKNHKLVSDVTGRLQSWLRQFAH